MSAQNTVRRITAPQITERKGGEPIVCLTAYDAPTAAVLDEHCDIGYDDTARESGDARGAARACCRGLAFWQL